MYQQFWIRILRSPDLTLTPSQLSENSERIQIHGQTQILSAVNTPNYPESAYQWLTGVLDGLIDFGQRHGHYGTHQID